MTDTNVAPGGGEQPVVASVTTPAPETPHVDEVRAAAQRLARARVEKQKQSSPAAINDAARAAMAGPVETPESAPADAAPPQEVPGTPTNELEPAEPPPIEPPRSWTKDEKDRFKSLPRETQEYISSREQEREREFRRSQNEVAEQRKAIEADRSKVDQARQQYESALPILLQNLQSAMAGEFADIQTMADVQRMANEDFPRYVRWDAQQKQLAAVQQEIVGAQQRQAQERAAKLEDFKVTEQSKLLESLPELADGSKFKETQEAAVTVLRDLGFKDDELGAYWRGESDISIHDHRFQRLLIEASLYRQDQQKKKTQIQELKSKAEQKPPVVRPGAAQPRQSSADAQLQALRQKAFTSGKDRDMAAYVSAKRAAARASATR